MVNQNAPRRVNFYTSTALEAVSLVTGTTALPYGAVVEALTVINSSGSTLWAQVFDGYSATVSNDGYAIYTVQVGANSQGQLAFGGSFQPSNIPFNSNYPSGRLFKNGIVVAFTSSLTTFTSAGSVGFINCWWSSGK